MATQPDDKAEQTYTAPWWLRQIARYEKTFDPWTQQGEKLLKLYAKQDKTGPSTERQFAMLYANTEVLKPSIYSRPPVPQVSRRFKDKDTIGPVMVIRHNLHYVAPVTVNPSVGTSSGEAIHKQGEVNLLPLRADPFGIRLKRLELILEDHL